MKINPNILSLKESATLKINQTALADLQKGKSIVHFGFGQSPFPVPIPMCEELKKEAHQKDYLPTQGLLPLREQIAKYYREKRNYQLTANEIAIGPGSKELIFQALFILPGDVLIPAPSWVSYGPQVMAYGRSFHSLFCDENNHYKLKASDLSDYCTQNLKDDQKILIINNPNNPSGAVYGDQEIAEITDVCRRHNIIVISDEIYGEIDFSREERKSSFLSLYPEGTIMTAGLSKSHSAGGWRLGLLATSPQLKKFLAALSTTISETYSSTSAPIQYAAIMAYSQHPEIERQISLCSQIHRSTGLYMAKGFREMGAFVSDPQGGFYLFPHFNAFQTALKKRYNVETSEQLTALIYDKTQVALLPASDFYMPPDFLGVRVASVDYDGTSVLRAASETSDINSSFVKQHCPRIAEGMERLTDFFSTL